MKKIAAILAILILFASIASAEDYAALAQAPLVDPSKIAGTSLERLGQVGFDDIEQAKTQVETLVEGKNWLGFADYVVVETVLNGFYEYQPTGNYDFDTVFARIMARKFYDYDGSVSFDLQIVQEADMGENNQYTIVFRNAISDQQIYVFLEKRADKYFLLVDTKAAAWYLEQFYSAPSYVEMTVEEPVAAPLYSARNKDGAYSAALYLNGAKGVSAFILHTDAGDIRWTPESPFQYSGSIIIPIGSFVSESPFMVTGLTALLEGDAQKEYQIIG